MTSIRDERDWDAWERSTNIAHDLVEFGNGDDYECFYVTVQEYYVGLHESSGGDGLRTTRYEFSVHNEDGTKEVTFPVTPWQMVSFGETLLRAGLRELRKPRRADGTDG